MSTSIRHEKNRLSTDAGAANPSPPGPEVLRRVLLGLTVALVVSRPLIAGEDVGLVQTLSGASGLFLTFGWLVLGLGWAAWRCWTGRAVWRGSWVEIGLAAVVLAVVVSTIGAAGYKHAGWVSGGEWLALLLAFCLVRQLANGPTENRRLVATLMAVAVALSGQGLYERIAELPRQLPRGRVTVPAVRELLANSGYVLSEDDPALQPRVERLRERSVSATYQRPAAFAGFLVLTLPLVLGWTVVTTWLRPWTWRMWAGVGVTGLVAVALWLTHAWPVILALVLVGILALLFRARQLLWHRRWWAAAGLLVVVGLGVLILRSTQGQTWLAAGRRFWTERVAVWSTTWAMIQQHGWLGVGSGSFGRLYPRYLAAAGLKVELPHDFALELWATCGVLALVGIAVAVAGFFVRVWQARRATPELTPEPEATESEGLPWEFYLGGMVGLCLGIFLWALDQPQLHARDFLWGGYVAAARSVLWFLAFALFDSLPWRGRGLAWALTVGISALLLALTVTDGISFPALALPLWIAAALALNLWLPGCPAAVSQARPRVLLPLPLLTAACLGYVFWILLPAVGCWWAMREAHAYAEAYHQNPAVRQPVGWADRRTADAILARLEQAGAADPGNVLPRLEYLRWAELELAQFRSRSDLGSKIEKTLKRVQELDPENKEGYLAEARLRLIQAQQIPGRRTQHLEQAAAALAQAVARDPSNPPLKQLQAQVLARSKLRPGARKPVRLPRNVVPPWPGRQSPSAHPNAGQRRSP